MTFDPRKVISTIMGGGRRPGIEASHQEVDPSLAGRRCDCRTLYHVSMA